MSIDGMRADHDPADTAGGAGHADQGDSRQPTTDRQPAETLTREEYADRIRARTSPIARAETPRGAESGNGRPDTEDQAAGTAERIQSRPVPDQPSRAEPGASARTGPGPATAAEAPYVAGDQTTSNQERRESRPDQAEDSAQPGSSPDATAGEPHWEDAWRLPDGRQVRVHMDGDRDWMHTASMEKRPTGEEILSMEDETP